MRDRKHGLPTILAFPTDRIVRRAPPQRPIDGFRRDGRLRFLGIRALRPE